MSRARAWLVGAACALATAHAPRVDAGCERELVVALRHRDGTPVAGGAVTVAGPDAAKGAPFTFRSSATTDARGDATFFVPAAGTYGVYVLAPRHRSESAEVRVGDAGTTLVLNLKATTVGTLSVQVRGAGDTPVDDANVHVEGVGAGDREARPPSCDALTDRTGEARFQLEGTSGWKVTVRHPRYEPDELEVAGPGELVDMTLVMMLEPRPEKTGAAAAKAEVRRAARPIAPRRTGSGETVPSPDEPSPDEPPPLEFPPLELPPIDAPPLDLPPTELAPTELPSTELAPTEGPAAGRPRKGAPPREPLRPLRPMPPPKGGTPNPPTPPPTDRPAPPTDAPPDETPADFAGTWRHTSGTTITLTQSGANVTGTWSHLDSRLTGTVRGRVLEFTTTSSRGLSTSGRVTLDASGRAFFGDGQVTGAGAGARFLLDAERPR